jgi:hypothetical protein
MSVPLGKVGRNKKFYYSIIGIVAVMLAITIYVLTTRN